MMTDFQDQRAVITGSASGIGRALVGQLLAQGSKVLALDVNAGVLARLADELPQAQGRLFTFVCDVSDIASVQAAKAEADRVMGGCDLLFNNAGVAYNAKPVWETPADQVDWNFEVNVYGVINGIRAFVPNMLARGKGHVINTASIGGFQVSERLDIWHQGLYAATKYAVVALSEALEIETRGKGVSVSILAPGGVATGIANSGSAKPVRFGGPSEGNSPDAMREMLAREGATPDFVAQVALAGVLAKQFYIFSHPAFAPRLEQRAAAIASGMAQSVALIEKLPPVPNSLLATS